VRNDRGSRKGEGGRPGRTSEGGREGYAEQGGADGGYEEEDDPPPPAHLEQSHFHCRYSNHSEW
jgi:hypothetical protein